MQLETRDGVALLRLAAGRGNAIGPAFLNSVNELLDALGNSDAGAAVLIGYERIFCAGLDLPTLIAFDRAAMRAFMQAFARTMLRVFEWPLPVVAAVNGHAIAGGCVLALQADVRFAADTALRIGLNETQLGLGLPAEVVETLRAQVPAQSLVPIALEGRLLAPAEALQLGLVDAVFAPDVLEARALERARALAAVPSAGYAQVKRALRAPHAERARAAQDAGLGPWLDTWFAPAARARLTAAVEKLQR